MSIIASSQKDEVFLFPKFLKKFQKFFFHFYPYHKEGGRVLEKNCTDFAKGIKGGFYPQLTFYIRGDTEGGRGYHMVHPLYGYDTPPL